MTNRDFQVFCLLYGDFLPLHTRLLSSLEMFLPKDVDVRLWCNQICPASRIVVDRFIKTSPDTRSAYLCNDNRPKYKAMSELFEPIKKAESTKKWVMWFDDDSYVVIADWWNRTREYLASKEKENVCYVGKCFFMDYKRGQPEFIKTLPWYTGLPLKTKGKTSIVHFATGGYWLLRTDVIRRLDWPPVKYGLSHNGGDTLLGEAIRQQGLPRHSFNYGVAINKAKRRGYNEARVGCLDKHPGQKGV